MPDQLLSETMGEDTTTQLYRDAEGGYCVRVMALPAEAGEKASATASPRVYQDQPVHADEARALFGASAAQRYVEADAAFPAAG